MTKPNMKNKRKIKLVCYRLIGVVLLIIKVIIIGLLTMNFGPVIIKVNAGLVGDFYANFASHAVAGLLWALIGDNGWLYWLNKEVRK